MKQVEMGNKCQEVLSSLRTSELLSFRAYEIFSSALVSQILNVCAKTAVAAVNQSGGTDRDP